MPREMVLRRPAAKAKARAKAKAKATAAARQYVARRPAGSALWESRQYEVIYISKVSKCDASFLVFRSSGVAEYRKILVDDDYVRMFQPYSENVTHYIPHIVVVKVPRNRVAREELPDDYYLGYMYGYIGAGFHIRTRQQVEMLADSAEYPLT